MLCSSLIQKLVVYIALFRVNNLDLEIKSFKGSFVFLIISLVITRNFTSSYYLRDSSEWKEKKCDGQKEEYVNNDTL